MSASTDLKCIALAAETRAKEKKQPSLRSVSRRPDGQPKARTASPSFFPFEA
jgi:hypothetical protein